GGGEGDRVAVLDVGRPEQLHQLDQHRRGGGVVVHRPGGDDGALRGEQHLDGPLDAGLVGRRGRGRREAGQIGERHGCGERGLLHARVQRDVGGPARDAGGPLVGGQHVRDGGGGGGGLGVPHDEVAHELGLGGGRVHPVDRAAQRRVGRAAAAEDEQRDAV